MNIQKASEKIKLIHAKIDSMCDLIDTKSKQTKTKEDIRHFYLECDQIKRIHFQMRNMLRHIEWFKLLIVYRKLLKFSQNFEFGRVSNISK